MSEQIKKIRFETDNARDFFAKNLAYTLGPVELKEMIEENKIRLIDVRAEEDYKISHIPNSINLPYEKIKEDLENGKINLSKEDINVVYCYNNLCHLGDRAAYKLADAGYPVMVMQGGFKSWTEDFHFAVISEK